MKVLIALDGSEHAETAAQKAVALFGPDAEYLAICVSPDPTTYVDPAIGYGGVYAYPMVGTPMIEEAEVRAEATVHESLEHVGLPDATAIADVGDPAVAIIDAADSHHVDVIVVAPTDKGWFSKLIMGSVADDVVHHAHVPVLVAR
jgi:nucleotide-binding universal stress UspA family protein